MTQSGLGRGLGKWKRDQHAQAPHPSTVHRGQTEQAAHKIVEENSLIFIATDKIHPNAYQPRRAFGEEKLQQLVRSIEAEGLLQPLLVKAKGNAYQLIAGERRLKACQQLKLPTVAAYILKADNERSAVLALIENLHREDLNPIEEAEGYLRLTDTFGMTQQRVADKVGKPRTVVANALRLLKLEEPIKAYLAEGTLSIGHAKVLLSASEGEGRIKLAEKTLKHNWNVRHLETQIRQSRHTKHPWAKKLPANKAELAMIADLENLLTEQLNTRVSLKQGTRKGHIIIEYQNKDELNRLLTRMQLNRHSPF